jgi:hypothetical protein
MMSKSAFCLPLILCCTLSGASVEIDYSCANPFGTTNCRGSVGIGGFGSNQISAFAFVETSNQIETTSLIGPPGFVAVSARATVITLGESRPGVLRILESVADGAANGTAAGGSLRVGPYECRGQDPLGCSLNYGGPRWLPFVLGVPFEVGLSAYAVSLGDGTFVSGGGAFAFLKVEFYEIRQGCEDCLIAGAPVSVFDRDEVPEPNTLLVVSAGIALLFWRARRRRQSKD